MSNMSSSAPDWDVLVVGRSFAGLSAALTLGRARRSVLLVGSGGPRNDSVLHAHGLITRDGASPSEVVALAEQELGRYPSIEIVDDRVLAIAPAGPAESADGRPWGFRATIGTRTTTATGVILATGVNDVIAEIPGLAEHWGRGVFTCPFCDGFEHGDLPLAVIGDPAIVAHTGRLLTGWSDRVTVYCDLAPDVVTSLRSAGVVVDERPVERIVGNGTSVSAVVLADGSTVPAGAVFSARMPIPNSQLAVALGCAVDDHGFVTVDAMQATTVASVWAAGDVSTMRHQMSFAIAGGAAAAASFVASQMS